MAPFGALGELLRGECREACDGDVRAVGVLHLETGHLGRQQLAVGVAVVGPLEERRAGLCVALAFALFLDDLCTPSVGEATVDPRLGVIQIDVCEAFDDLAQSTSDDVELRVRALDAGPAKRGAAVGDHHGVIEIFGVLRSALEGLADLVLDHRLHAGDLCIVVADADEGALAVHVLFVIERVDGAIAEQRALDEGGHRSVALDEGVVVESPDAFLAAKQDCRLAHHRQAHGLVGAFSTGLVALLGRVRVSVLQESEQIVMGEWAFAAVHGVLSMACSHTIDETVHQWSV